MSPTTPKKPSTPRRLIFVLCLLFMLGIGAMRALGFSLIPNWGNIGIYVLFIGTGILGLAMASAIQTTLTRRLAYFALALLLAIGTVHAIFHIARFCMIAEEEIARVASPKEEGGYALALRIDAGGSSASALRVELRREWGGMLRWSKVLLIRDRADDCRLAWLEGNLLVVEYYGYEEGVELVRVR